MKVAIAAATLTVLTGLLGACSSPTGPTSLNQAPSASAQVQSFDLHGVRACSVLGTTQLTKLGVRTLTSDEANNDTASRCAWVSRDGAFRLALVLISGV